MTDPAPAPMVLMHLGWPRDRELVGGLLRADGAEPRPTPPAAELRRLLAEGRPDLILADTLGGLASLGDLLRSIDAVPGAAELPLVLLADPGEVAELGDLVLLRPNAVLLSKPVDPGQLRAAVGAGLRCWAGRRRERGLVARLAAANAELLAANEELSRRRAEAEEAHRRYHDLVHGTDAIVWEAECPSGRLSFVSRRAEAWFGGPAGRWEGLADAWLDRVIPEDRDYAREGRRRALAEPRDFEIEYRVRAVDGRTVWLHEAARVARDSQGVPTGLRGLVRDITRRKKVERQLYRAKTELVDELTDLAHLHRIGSDLSTSSGLEETQEEVMASVMGLVGAEIGLLRLVNGDGGELEIAASAGLPAEYVERYRRVPALAATTGRPSAERGPVLVPDVDADEAAAAFREHARLGGYRGVFAVPLTGRDGRLLGLIATFFRDRHAPSPRQVRLVELYARQAAAAIESARLQRGAR